MIYLHGPSRDAYAASRSRLEEIVGGQADVAALSDGLLAVSSLLDREAPLRRALGDPALPGDVKSDLVRRLLGEQVSAPVVDLLEVVVRQRWSRAKDLPEVVELLGVQAAFAVAQGAGELDDVEDELFRFGRIVSREPGLWSALSDLGASVDRRQRLVGDLLRDRVRPATLRLVALAIAAPRGRSVDRALEDFADLAAQLRQRQVAVVTVAAPLTEEQTRRLAGALARVFGREVQIQFDIDPSVQGGVVVRVGDEVIDGSVTRRLEEARRRLTR